MSTPRERQLKELLREEAAQRAAPPGAVIHRILPDGRLAAVIPELFFEARLTVSEFRPRAPEDERHFYDDYWRYRTVASAVTALLEWDGDGEPQGHDRL